MKAIPARRAALDLTAREFFVDDTRFGSDGRERLFIGDASLAVRIYRQHAIGVSYQLAHRRSFIRSGSG